MWWLEKMSKQPGERLLCGFTIFSLTLKAVSIDVHTDSERHVRHIIMPARPRFAISGILAGGIPGFCIAIFLLGTLRFIL